jgi:hypothetical protein
MAGRLDAESTTVDLRRARSSGCSAADVDDQGDQGRLDIGRHYDASRWPTRSGSGRGQPEWRINDRSGWRGHCLQGNRPLDFRHHRHSDGSGRRRSQRRESLRVLGGRTVPGRNENTDSARSGPCGSGGTEGVRGRNSYLCLGVRTTGVTRVTRTSALASRWSRRDDARVPAAGIAGTSGVILFEVRNDKQGTGGSPARNIPIRTPSNLT